MNNPLKHNTKGNECLRIIDTNMIRLLVDSSADYTLQEITDRKLDLIPLTVMINDKSYLDTIELNRNDFYEMLLNGADFPKTSQPSPEKFLEIFNDAKEKGDEVVCILLSSSISGTCQSAHLAKSIADYDKVYIIDSLSATFGIRLMAEYALKLRKEGKSGAEIAELVENMKSRVKIYAMIDTLEYLCKGGRISRASAAVGTIANIKPMITVTQEGKVEVIGKCIGRVKALNQLMKYLSDTPADPDFPFYTLFAYGEETCEKLEKKLAAENYNITERLQLGCTIGAHIGPGACAIIYVAK